MNQTTASLRTIGAGIGSASGIGSTTDTAFQPALDALDAEGFEYTVVCTGPHPWCPALGSTVAA